MNEKETKNKELELEDIMIFDENVEKDFIKEAKKKNRIHTAAVSFLTIALIVVLAVLLKVQMTPYVLDEKISGISSQYEQQGANLFLAGWSKSEHLFGSSAETVKYKLVDGIPVYQGTVSTSKVDNHRVVSKSISNEWTQNQYEKSYSVYGNKVMQFFHPIYQYDRYSNDLDAVAQIGEKERLEVGVSFDKEYTLKQVKSMLPSDVNLNWCWVNDLTKDEEKSIQNTPDEFDYGVVIFEQDATGFPVILADGSPRINLDREISEDEKNSIIGAVFTGTKDEIMQLKGLPFIKAISLGAVVTEY